MNDRLRVECTENGLYIEDDMFDDDGFAHDGFDDSREFLVSR